MAHCRLQNNKANGSMHYELFEEQLVPYRDMGNTGESTDERKWRGSLMKEKGGGH